MRAPNGPGSWEHPRASPRRLGGEFSLRELQETPMIGQVQPVSRREDKWKAGRQPVGARAEQERVSERLCVRKS